MDTELTKERRRCNTGEMTQSFQRPSLTFNLQSLGTLQVISQVAKDGPVNTIRHSLPDYFSIISAIDDNTNLQNNIHIRKLKYKLSARVALRLLPPKRINKIIGIYVTLTLATF
jgi:hypothetical protein